jgi:trimeric autotransporter adhesin
MAMIKGNDLPNTLSGTVDDDFIYGYGGDDALNGGAGNDKMWGGAGNDTYVIDSIADFVYEDEDDGIDTVYAHVSDRLDGNVENLYLFGAATKGTGNALDNKIVGNGNDNTLKGLDGNDSLYGYDGNDILFGGAGNDKMWGGAGNDTYVIDSAADFVYEAEEGGIDTVYAHVSDRLDGNVENLYLYGAATSGTGNALDNKIVGNGNDNTLKGLAGNDTLNGGVGSDHMWGGAGNDTYVIDSAGDVAYEAENDGTDKVYAYVSDTLDGNFENLYLFGVATSGTGNALDNKIAGNGNDNTLKGLAGNDSLYGYDSADSLDGGAGNDKMWGGAGNDIYVVDSAGDFVYEAADAGVDTVYAHVSDTLDGNFENLYLYGAAASGTGNALDNRIAGNGNDNTLAGLAGADILYGYAGADSLDGGVGGDKMWGGTGNDTYVIDSAADVACEAEDEGDDTVYAYVNDTLDGNVENLYLYGAATSGTGNALENTIYGNGNDNILKGLGGDDSLDGGAGNDHMWGGTGNDIYVVESAGDVVYEAADAGDDAVYAYVSDKLDGNVENLYLFGAATNGTGNTLDNTIYGNGNANTLKGFDGNDSLSGYEGDDILDGGAGSDSLYGGEGDDTLDGSGGDDRMEGGAGNDGYVVDNAGDVVYEMADAGNDTIHASVDYTLDDNVEILRLHGSAITGAGNALDNLIYGNSCDNALYGLDGNDTLDGNDGEDTIEGGKGNDSIDGGAGNDHMWGGAGNDAYVVDSLSDVVYEMADAGNDTISAYISYILDDNVEILRLFGTGYGENIGTGNALDNMIYGSDNNGYTMKGLAGNDTLYGGMWGDTLDGGAGDDFMSGGHGGDTYVVDSSGDVVVEEDDLFYYDNRDTVDAYLSYILGANVEILRLHGSAINGTGNELDNEINGTENDNLLYGLAGNDTLSGYDGNDALDGSAGNDILCGDAYYNYEAGGVGDDTLYGGAGDDTLYGDHARLYQKTEGNGGDDILHGGAGDDTLYGDDDYPERMEGGGDDTLYGDDGNDTLDGGTGNDSLYGGDGDDTLDGGGDDDRMEGGAGNDHYFIDSLGDVVYEMADAGNDTITAGVDYTLDENIEILRLGGKAHGTGNALDNVIIGSYYDNTLYGLDGNDTLDGGAGYDTLDGGAGNDILYGGTGNDRLIGGDGQDRFCFVRSGQTNFDTISDFLHTDDTIVLEDLLDHSDGGVIEGLSFTDGVLNPGSYSEGAGCTGNGTQDSGIYNDTATGYIWYNETDIIAGDSVLICVVGAATAPSLDNTDFMYSA